MPWHWSAIKEVNDWALSMYKLIMEQTFLTFVYCNKTRRSVTYLTQWWIVFLHMRTDILLYRFHKINATECTTIVAIESWVIFWTLNSPWEREWERVIWLERRDFQHDWIEISVPYSRIIFSKKERIKFFFAKKNAQEKFLPNDRNTGPFLGPSHLLHLRQIYIRT